MRNGGSYRTADKSMMGVDLAGKSLNVARDLHIKGFVYGGESGGGGGSIHADSISFEAPGTSVLNDEAEISFLSNKYIRIKRASSVGGGVNAGSGIAINGVIWAENGGIVITPGTKEDVSIRGSLICKGGPLTLTSVNNFEIVYDPTKAQIMATYIKDNNNNYGQYGDDGTWNPNSENLRHAVETGTGVVNVGTPKLFNRI